MRTFAVVAALLSCSTPASAAGGFPYDFHCHNRECASHVVTGLTSSEFAAEFSVQKAKNLMLVDYDMHVDTNGQTLVSGVYKENFDSRGWLAKRGMTTSSFAVQDVKQRTRGYRLLEIEYYSDKGLWRVAAIWVKNVEDRQYKYQLNVSKRDYYAKLNDWRSKWVPVDVDIYEKGGALRYNTVWCQKKNGDNVDWRLHTDLQRSEYNAKVTEYQGYVVTDFESAVIGGTQRYVALFFKASSAQIGAYKWRTDISKAQLSQLLDEQDDLGRRVVELEVYNYGTSSVRYGATWWENDRAKSRWASKGTVDSIVETYMTSSSITGVSVTVVKDGDEKYSRGFGKADVAGSVAATTHTIYRLASVSKGVGAVLASLLEQKGKINLDAPAKPLIDTALSLDTLPQAHRYTVRQTMTHRSGLRHYHANDNVWDDSNPTYTTAAAALPMLPYSKALTNAVGTYVYSTHAYTFTAAALEGATGKPITTLVREYLRDGEGVSSLAAEHEAPTRERRAKLYNADGTQFTEKDDLSWKVLGGGLEASSKDLGVFFDRLIRNEILTSSNLAAMFNVPDGLSSYGTGFVKGTIDGATTYSKNGAQDGASSYVIMAPSKGYSIVVLSNQRNNLADNIATDIARALW
eukprot:Rhum_TRINITY_DN14994_c1_g1::Rhum_TRINITY_DN14994_c1_g1_i5::g.131651::m.131651